MKNVEDVYPLSATQQGMLFHSLYEGSAAGTYTGHIAYDLQGRLDLPAFERSWQQVVDRHAVLRTAFLWEGLDQPLQVVRREIKVPFEQQDWRGLPPKVQEKWLAAFLKADRERGFDPKQAPLLRVAVVRLTEEDWKVVWSFHLMMVDGWSLPLLFNEVAAFYAAFSRGHDLDLPRPRPFRDYIAWLERQDLAQAEQYWRRTLRGFTSPTPFAVDRPAGEDGPGEQADRQLQLSSARTAELMALARALRLTLNTLVQGAWALLLARYSGEQDVVFGATVSGRPPELAGVEEIIGLFINTLPVRVAVPSERPVGAWLQCLQAHQAEQRQFEHSPLLEIQKWSEMAPGRPLFESIVVFENYPAVDRGFDGDGDGTGGDGEGGSAGAGGNGAGLRLGDMGIVERTNYPVALAVETVPELVLHITYDQARFAGTTVARMLGHLAALLAGMQGDPDGSLASLAMLTAAERQQVAIEWSDTARLPLAPRPVVELVAAQARRQPERTAVAGAGESLCYGELERRASRLARFLVAKGIAPGARVGLCLERSPDAVVGILGIWKCRAVYVPLDPAYPQERLAFLREDSGMTLVLTRSGLAAAAAGGGAAAVLLDDPGLAAAGGEPFSLPVALDDPAYLIYTSGTSGRPKAVTVDHRNLLHTLLSCQQRFAFAPGSRMPHLASFSFDISLFELLNPLAAGGTSVIVTHEEMLDLPLLLGHLEAATHLHAVPSLMRQIVAAIEAAPPAAPATGDRGALRHLFVGGDLVPPGLLDAMRAAFPGAAVVVLYGPTEATIICTAHPVPPGPAAGHLIGRPLDNVVVRLLDSHRRPVPIGLAGEVYLGGGGVARGYLGRPELTAEKFVDLAAGRFYRSGDLACFRPDGVLEFLGRADEQVKVRGHRVELGEVESVLAAHHGIREVAVDVRPSDGERRLVAYVVPVRGQAATASELRQFAQRQLPDFMVPAFFVIMDRLPLGPTGKVDRRALPAPEGARTAALAVAYEAPRTRNEQVLASLFAEVFGRQQIGIHDNFFELGGDSLVALKVVGRASRLGLSIPPRLLVENPTIARLAAKVTSAAQIRVERGLVKGPVPLTPIQLRFFEQAPPNPSHFNIATLLTVRRSIALHLAEKILRQVISHHDALRLRFVHDGAAWQQTNLLPEDRVPIVLADLSAAPADRQAALIEEVASALQLSLDVSRGPMVRVGLFDLGPGRQGRLVLIFHHLVADLVSAHLLREDLSLAFEAASRGEAIVLPPKTTSFKYWAERLVEGVAAGAFDGDLAYWLATARAGAARLPIDLPGGGNTEADERRAVADLAADAAHALFWEAPKAYRMQVREILLAALALALARWTGERQILVDLEGHGRERLFDDVDVSRTVGWFAAIYPVLFDLGGSLALGDVLKAVKEQLRGVPNHGTTYGMLRYLGKDPERAASFRRQPAAEIRFSYRGGTLAGARSAAAEGAAMGATAAFAMAAELAGDEADPRRLRQHMFGVDLWPIDNRLRVSWRHGRMHRPETAEALLTLYLETLQELVRHCALPEVGGCTPSDFPLARLTQAQLDQLVGSGREIEDVYPLAPLQEGMMFHALLAPEAGMYINQTIAQLEGELDLEDFRQAWQVALDRHAVLRTGFACEGLQQPLQVVWRSASMPIELFDWSCWDDAAVAGGLERYLGEDLRRGFDLARPPLMRVALMKRRAGLHEVVWSCHHILVDGESQSRLFDEVGLAYGALRAGRPPQQPVVRPFRDYIEWWLAQDAARAAEFWRQALAGAPAATPLVLAPLPGEPGAVRERRLALAAAEHEAMLALARRAQVTLNTLAQGAWALLLARYSGEPEVVYGLTVFGRPLELEGAEAMIGMFINTLPLRIEVSGEETLGSWLRRLQERHLAMREFEHSPLTAIRRWAELPPQHALFHNILVSQADAGDEEPPPGDAAGPAPSLRVTNLRTQARTHVPLMARVVPSQWLSLAFEAGRYDAVDVERALRHWHALLAAFLADGEGQLAGFEMLSGAERQQVLREWNDTAGGGGPEAPAELVAERVWRWAAATPAAPAVETARGSWSYGALARWCDALAAALRALGVGRGERVGVCLERGLEQAGLPLALWRAGAVYVPLDPAAPPARQALLAADAGLRGVVTSAGLLGLWRRPDGASGAAGGGDELAVWTVEALVGLQREGEGAEVGTGVSKAAARRAGAAAQRPDGAAAGLDGEATAYLIYTSGTTGGPKAVAVSHGNLAATIGAVCGAFGFGRGERMLHLSAFSFDISLFELLAPLASGGVVRLLERTEILDGERLAAAVSGVRRLHAVPGLMRVLAEAVRERGSGGSVETAFVGGERVGSEVLSAMFEAMPGASLVVLYGPTEGTMVCAGERLREARGGRIGRPLPGVELRVVDERGEPQPVGVGGELWLGGPGVAQGYWRRAELSAERFVERQGRRYYRTGDRARWTAVGSLEFLGRLDEQVKLRGFRIELGEVEEALRGLAGVGEAAVVLRAEPGGEPRLVAYAAPAAKTALPPAEELRAGLAALLPDYMVPAAVVELDALPRLPNGKLDRRALAERAPAALVPAGHYEPPRTRKEQRLAAIWSEVLGVPAVGIHDDFFALGGDSLMALKIAGQARRAGLAFTLRQLFEQPTVAALARQAGEGAAPLAEQGVVEGPLPLTPIQLRFFAAAPLAPNRFTMSALMAVRRPLDATLARRVAREILAHHDALRLRFERGTGSWRQRNAGVEAGVPVVLVDLAAVGAGRQREAIERVAVALQSSLDIERGPLMRLGLMELGEGRPGRLLLVFHHLAMDVVSLAIVREDLGQALAALAGGKPVQLPAKTTSYRQWAERLAEHAASAALAAELPYWQAPERSQVRPLPVDFALGGNLAGTVREAAGELPPAETERLLREVPRPYRMRPQEVLLAALALAVARWTGDGLVLVDVESHGREELRGDLDLSRTVGWFTAIHPVLLDVRGAPEPGQVLMAVKEQLRVAPGRGIGYGLLRYLRQDAALQQQPQAEIGFNFSGLQAAGESGAPGGSRAAGEGGKAGLEGTAGGEDRAGAPETLFASADEELGEAVDPRERRPHLLQLEVSGAGGCLRWSFGYSGAVYRAATMARLSELYLGALRELAAHCLAPGAGACTPADFPLVQLAQAQLDRLAGNGREVEDVYPLTPLQHGMLFHALLAPGEGLYINQMTGQLVGELDLAAFRGAWETVLARHPILRTGFVHEGLEQPLQVVRRGATVAIELLDWEGASDEEVEARSRRYLAADLARGFDLGQPPLMRLALMRRGAALHEVVWSCHHILVDGESQSRLFGEAARLYESLHAGRPAGLTAPRPYRDYIAWLARQDSAQAEAFWRRSLAGISAATPLPFDTPGGEGGLQDERSLLLSPAQSASLADLARRQRVTFNTVVQAAWSLLLARYGSARDVLYGLTVFGRPPDLEDADTMVGMFINTLPVRLAVPATASLGAWLREIQQQQLAAREFEHTRLVDIQRWSEIPPGEPLFRALLVFQGRHGQDGDGAAAGTPAPSLEVRNLRLRSRSSFPLAAVPSAGRELSLQLNFDRCRFQAATITRMLRHWRNLLVGFAAAPEAAAGDFALLDAAERQQLVREWNDTRRWYPRQGLYGLFAAQASARADAPAVICGARQTSYGELWRQAGRLGRRLRRLGVGPEVRVGLCLERSPEMLEAILGVLAAGGAYVPMDPGFPAERLGLMARDAGLALVLAAGGGGGLPDLGCPVLSLAAAPGAETVDGGAAVWGAGAAGEGAGWWAGVAVPAEALAYVIYTSGSTGEPKGIGISQGAVCRLVLESGFLPFGAGQRIGHLSNVAFDAATFEIWGALLHGGVVVVVPREAALDPAALGAALAAAATTSLFLTTALFNQLAHGAPAALAGLDHLLFGGELVDPQRVRELLLSTERPGLLQHVYGPTESTTFATRFAVESVGEEERTVAIGRPLANTTAYVVEGWGWPAPLGAEGELWLGGDGLARGYVGQPAQTAERFVPDGFGEAGGRLYRTGDRVRLRADGRIEFVGRLDAQVKLRGFRIELGEIEAALLRQPGVLEAVVELREERSGERRLVGYVVGEPGLDSGAPLDMAVLRQGLSSSLPEYMVPAALVALERLPLTATGKVDRRALPAPGSPYAAGRPAPARTAVEESLLGLWSEVLGVVELGIHDDFFALGGHSLLATRLISRVRGAFQVELPLRDLFEEPTVAGLARRLEAARRQGLGLEAPPLVAADRSGPLPLSFAQQRLWFLQQLNPASVAYNLVLPLRVSGALDLERLDGSLTAIVARHEVLRTTFGMGAQGEPEQRIAAPWRFRFDRIDLAALPEAARQAELHRLVAGEAGRPFDLGRGPLLRGQALRLGVGEHAVLFTLHHVVTDGWSMEVLTREVVELYRSAAEGREARLPALAIQYADYAQWQRRWLSGEVLERQVAHWRQVLAGAPEVTELPLDRPRRLGRGAAGGSWPLELTAAETAALQQLGQREGATLFMVALCGVLALLARYSGQPRVSVGSPIAGRNREQLEPLIGFFVNTLVMHADLGGEPSFAAALRRVREVALTAYDHQELPFEKLVEELNPARDRTHGPLFQVMFALRRAALDTPEAAPVLPDLKLRRLEQGGDAVVAKFELTVALEERGGRLSGSLDYSRALFDPATAGRLVRHLGALLRAASATPSAGLAELPLLDAAERQQLVREWNDTRRWYPRQGLYGLFAAQASARADAPAVICGARQTSYGELWRQAGRLGRRLRRLGVGPEVRVGLCLERSPEMLEAILGVLAAGGAYVPMDPGFPAERLGLMARDAGLALVLTAGGGGGLPDLGCPVLSLAAAPGAGTVDGGAAVWGAGAAGEGAGWWAGVAVPAEALAYVIYTSGSTGEPKGIGISQGAVCRLVLESGFLPFGAGQRIGHLSNVAFDAATFEIWGALLHGGVVVVVPREAALDPAALGAALAAAATTSLFLTTALFNQLAHGAPAALAGLDHLLFGGELVDPQRVRELLLSTERPGLLQHVYGPTESTTFATRFAVESVGEEERTVAIGRPLANTTAYVVEGWGWPAPLGAEGELWLGGDGLARGYVGQPAQTAERFVPDGFGEAGGRLYRTGDRVRLRADGRIEFVGRLDAQVKLRGFRIELGEIEAALLRQPGVLEAVVELREERSGERRLVGYVVGEPGLDSGAPLDMAVLRQGLSSSLPEYMVPAALVALERLPLTATGKVDRRALPAPGSPYAAGRPAPARTAVEESLLGLWSEVLGVVELGIHDDFFALGGHSLLATRLISRVRGAFQVELPLRDLFEEPTVAGLARRLEAARRQGLGLEAPPLVAADRSGPLPLSFAQQRLWFLQQLNPASVAYNLVLPLRVSGALDLERLDGSLTAIVARHEVLRTTFGMGAQGEPEQRIAAPWRFRFDRIDLAALPEAARQAELHRLVAGEAGRPFDLGRGPLLRGQALRLGVGEHAVLFTLHHVVTDGWSMEVLTREVVELYRSAAEGREARLPALAIQYADHAQWQRRWLSGEVLERQVAHWRQVLAGAPEVTELPLDRPRRLGRGAAGGSWPLELTAAETAALQQLGQREGATLFMVALCGVLALLARYSGQPRVSVGSPIAGRNREQLEPLIGFFVNTLVMHADLGGEPSFAAALRRVREVALTAYDHQELPFEKLVEELNPARDRTYNPLFQVMFVFQASSQGGGAEGRRIELPDGLSLAPLGDRGASHTPFDLAVQLRSRELLAGEVVFNAELFDAATAGRLAGHLGRLLLAAAADPARSLWEIPLLAPSEAHQLAREWSAGAAAPAWRSVLAQFAGMAARSPEAPAVLAGDQTLTYRELDRRSDQLARRLVALGVGPEVRVGLFLRRSMAVPVAILATWKAGGAYLPLDPKLPADRLRYMVADGAPEVMVTERALAASAPGGHLPQLVLDAAGPAAAAAEEVAVAGALPGEPLPLQAAYLLYTSGSTGRPKAVVVAHLGMGHLAAALRSRYRVGPGSRVLQFAALSFDVALWELLMALCAGGALCVERAEDLLPGPALVDRLRQLEITHLTLLPSAVRELPAGDLPRLAVLTVGGEAWPPDLAAKWSSRQRLINAYGPTETTVAASWWEVPGGYAGRPPIGWPLPATRIYVLDGRLLPLPSGAAGEICLAGDGLARGYAGRPELTAERFVPDPHGPAGSRLYRTGDVGRRLVDGNVDCLGRRDQQVKLRGFRIELEEIEAALCAQAGVRAAVVALREDRPGDPRLAGYYVAAEEIDSRALRQGLAAVLPDYMVPAALVRIESLPLAPNGKVDRRALPPPAAVGQELGELALPRTPLEEALLGLWSEVLAIPRLGIHDDFFALGGHSLLATRLLSRVRPAFQVELPLRDLFEAPTVARLAQRIEAARRQGLGLEAPPLARVDRAGHLPLSFGQQRLWFLQQFEPRSTAYNMVVPLAVRGRLDLDLLDASLSEVQRRHEVLRTTFATSVGGEPEQRIAAPRPFRFARVDLAALAAPARQAELRQLLAAEGRRRFDLESGPLLRGTTVRLAAEEHAVVLSLHHVASDGWSMEVLTREVIELYRAGLERRPARLPELPVQYADYAQWQRAWLSGEVLAREVAHWRQALAGAPEVTELPLDRLRRQGQGAAAGHAGIELGAAATAALKELGRRLESTLFMVVLAGFQALLARYSQDGRVSVGAPVAGRNREELEPLIGFFVNTLVMHVDLAGELTFGAALRRVRETALTAYDHQDLPFEKLVEELQPERHLTHGPLIQVTFALQARSRAAGEESAVELPGGLAIAPLGEGGGGPGNAAFDLVAQLRAEERLAGELIYRRELFDRTTALRLGRQLENLLTAAAADPDLGLWELPLLAAAERHQLVGEWNDTLAAYPRQGLFGLFAAQAAARPRAAAVVFADRVLAYGELARQAAGLGAYLRRLGIGIDARVGICMERSPEMFVATLGTLAAGAAYVPLDPGYPARRLAFMVGDSGVAAVLTLGRLRGALPEIACPVLALDELDAELAAGGAAPALPDPAEVPAEALACVIYTSGSTGEPKAIGVPQGGVCRLVLNDNMNAFTAADRIGHLSNVSFDAATQEIWGALLNGATAVGIPRQVALDPGALAGALEQGGVTHLVLTTALFNQVVRAAPAAFRRLERLLVAGEAFDPSSVRELLAGADRPRRLINAYGPAECTTAAAFHRIDDVGPDDWTVPIGLPLSNTTAHVIDPSWRLAPLGALGELWLGGDGVARGYLGQPALTAERFVPDAWGAPGGRLYRTGDRVRRRADGRLEFHGRLDGQVKLRGFRIELGEIEAALLRQEGILQAAVLLRQDRGGDPRLVGYFTGGEESDERALRLRLAETLPEYMVPAVLLRLAALPLTANGKLDRRALPAPEAAGALAAAAPRDDLERQLVEVWSELLGRAVGIHDNFFELGGHSLLAIRLMSKLKPLTSRSLPVSVLFHGPTVAELAGYLRSSAGRRTSCLVPIQGGGDRPALFLVHGGTGQVLRFGELGRRFAGERPVFGLQSAGLDDEEAPLTNVADMAAHYLREVRGQQPSGPYHLAGWSLGGLVALEMACQLEAAGEGVAYLGILDAHFPRAEDRMHIKDPLALLATFAQDFGLDLRQIGIEVDDLDGKPAMEQVRLVLERAKAARLVPEDIELQQIQRLYEIFCSNARATSEWRPRRCAGRVVFYRAAEPLARPDDSWFARLHERGRRLARRGLTSTRPWQRLLGEGLVLRRVSGHHFSMLVPPHVEALAAQLRRDLQTEGGEGTKP